MAINTPKLKIETTDGATFEVQTLPWDLAQAGDKFPDLDMESGNVFRQAKVMLWLAWHASVRDKLITEAQHRQRFEAWAPSVADVTTTDDTEGGADPTDPAAQENSS